MASNAEIKEALESLNYKPEFLPFQEPQLHDDASLQEKPCHLLSSRTPYNVKRQEAIKRAEFTPDWRETFQGCAYKHSWDILFKGQNSRVTLSSEGKGRFKPKSALRDVALGLEQMLATLQSVSKFAGTASEKEAAVYSLSCYFDMRLLKALSLQPPPSNDPHAPRVAIWPYNRREGMFPYFPSKSSLEFPICTSESKKVYCGARKAVDELKSILVSGEPYIEDVPSHATLKRHCAFILESLSSSTLFELAQAKQGSHWGSIEQGSNKEWDSLFSLCNVLTVYGDLIFKAPRCGLVTGSIDFMDVPGDWTGRVEEDKVSAASKEAIACLRVAYSGITCDEDKIYVPPPKPSTKKGKKRSRCEADEKLQF